MREILYTIARLQTGAWVLAADAHKGDQFFCPKCSGAMNLRKSGKTGPNSKRPYFAYQSLTPNCTPESALHYSFKNFVFEKISTWSSIQTRDCCRKPSIRSNSAVRSPFVLAILALS
jgi:competence CoiA-like predicted nuclease